MIVIGPGFSPRIWPKFGLAGQGPQSPTGAGLGCKSWPTGQVRVWKNPTRTRPVVIPTSDKPPMVLRQGGPSLEIVRPKKESLNTAQNHNFHPDIQEQN